MVGFQSHSHNSLQTLWYLFTGPFWVIPDGVYFHLINETHVVMELINVAVVITMPLIRLVVIGSQQMLWR